MWNLTSITFLWVWMQPAVKLKKKKHKLDLEVLQWQFISEVFVFIHLYFFSLWYFNYFPSKSWTNFNDLAQINTLSKCAVDQFCGNSICKAVVLSSSLRQWQLFVKYSLESCSFWWIVKWMICSVPYWMCSISYLTLIWALVLIEENFLSVIVVFWIWPIKTRESNGGCSAAVFEKGLCFWSVKVKGNGGHTGTDIFLLSLMTPIPFHGLLSRLNHTLSL